MRSIARVHAIDKKTLSGEFYFSSLTQEGFSKNLLLKSDLENIQMECFELLRHKTKLYTSDASCSVPVTRAESIMKSNLYTIGLYLKTFPCPDDALEVLIKEDISLLYENGVNVVKRKIHLAKHMHEMVKSNIVETENYTYTSTLLDAIDGFFKLYDPEFQAYDYHITADYPLSLPVTDLSGVEFIIEYLQRAYYENKFCGYFSSDNILQLLKSYNIKYEELVFNIFQVIFISSLGCSLLKKAASDLVLTSLDIENLTTMLKERSLNDIEIILYNGFISLITELGITNAPLIEYLEVALEDVTSNIHHAISIDQPELVFVHSKNTANGIKIDFSLGEKMHDSIFRTLIDEIKLCRYSSDKIALIMDSIKSLADLEDICLNANLSNPELMEIFSKLAPIELSVFVYRHLKDLEFQDDEILDQEMFFRSSLMEFLKTLSPEKKLMVEKLSEVINIGDGSQLL